MVKPENVKCPDCGGPMKPRTSQYGKFWGCINYPRCKGTRDSEGNSKKDKESDEDSEGDAFDHINRWNKR